MKSFKHYLEDVRNKVGELVPINLILQGPIVKNLELKKQAWTTMQRYRKGNPGTDY